MALSALWQAARQRLATFYNGGVRIPEAQPSANPGGLDGDGHTVNFVPALRDVATVGQGIAEAVAGIDADIETSGQNATSAAESAAAAAASAERAQTWDPAGYARLASPAFSGNPTAPTAPAGDRDTTIANTEFVQREAARSACDLNLHYGS